MSPNPVPNPALQPRDGLRASPIAAVVLTGGEIDQTAGLLALRERHAFSIHASGATLEKAITIDVTPPMIELVADDRYINFGGVGAIVYKSSPDTATSGVKIGDAFFPGFQGPVNGHPDYYFCLFAHPYNAAPDAKAVLFATDRAGNTRQMTIAYDDSSSYCYVNRLLIQ